MKLYEILYREITTDFMNGINRFTQKDLSERLHISISNVNKAIKRLEEINSVVISRRSFRIIAFDRILLYWATHRKLYNDIIYESFSNMNVIDTENSLPNGIAFTAYSGYKKLYNDVPADYDEVFVYAIPEAIEDIKIRFPKHNKYSNLFILKADYLLYQKIIQNKQNVVPASNVFVDLWNIRTWYAKEFADVLLKKLTA